MGGYEYWEAPDHLYMVTKYDYSHVMLHNESEGVTRVNHSVAPCPNILCMLCRYLPKSFNANIFFKFPTMVTNSRPLGLKLKEFLPDKY